MRHLVARILVLIALLAGFTFLPPVQVSKAGSNGQQLRIYVDCVNAPAFDGIQVTGYNNSNQWVTKSWSFNPPVRSMVTYNHWWKTWAGKKVTIAYHYSGYNPYYPPGTKYQWYGVLVDVPVSYGSNEYPVNLNQYNHCNPY